MSDLLKLLLVTIWPSLARSISHTASELVAYKIWRREEKHTQVVQRTGFDLPVQQEQCRKALDSVSHPRPTMEKEDEVFSELYWDCDHDTRLCHVI